MTCRTPRKRLLLAAAPMAITAPIVFSQAAKTHGKALAFEVAAIKQNKTSPPRWRMEFTADGVTATDVTLLWALTEAYGVYDDRRWSGGPPWLNSARFDIKAKFDPSEYKNLTLDQRRAMLQALLADRFKLAVHHESKEFPVYALVLGKKGPKFEETKPENSPVCHVLRSRRNQLEMKGCSLSQLASDLNGGVDRIVVDKTGLSGRYDFNLSWTPDTASDSTTLDSSAPSIFTAVEEQLGLKLKPTKAPLDTIVIDHAEMPSEN